MARQQVAAATANPRRGRDQRRPLSGRSSSEGAGRGGPGRSVAHGDHCAGRRGGDAGRPAAEGRLHQSVPDRVLPPLGRTWRVEANFKENQLAKIESRPARQDQHRCARRQGAGWLRGQLQPGRGVELLAAAGPERDRQLGQGASSDCPCASPSTRRRQRSCPAQACRRRSPSTSAAPPARVPSSLKTSMVVPRAFLGRLMGFGALSAILAGCRGGSQLRPAHAAGGPRAMPARGTRPRLIPC